MNLTLTRKEINGHETVYVNFVEVLFGLVRLALGLHTEGKWRTASCKLSLANAENINRDIVTLWHLTRRQLNSYILACQLMHVSTVWRIFFQILFSSRMEG